MQIFQDKINTNSTAISLLETVVAKKAFDSFMRVHGPQIGVSKQNNVDGCRTKPEVFDVCVPEMIPKSVSGTQGKLVL